MTREAPASFAEAVRMATASDQVVVQPRAGVADLEAMRRLILGVRDQSHAPARAGTITIDAYTRQGHLEAAAAALKEGKTINGFPLLAHDLPSLRSLAAEQRPDFGVQIRHGTPDPRHLYRRIAEAGFSATEGGPLSYCLVYGRLPVADAALAWDESLRTLAQASDACALEMHHESFGGCMMGQLCPPDVRMAISVLECCFFAERGIPSVSASLALGTSAAQDEGALLALGDLCRHYLGGVDHHLVAYHFMGLFPETVPGSLALIGEQARTAARGGAHRLIVKTRAEAHGIPTLADNIEALDHSARAAVESRRQAYVPGPDVDYWRRRTCENASRLIDAVIALAPTLDAALVGAVRSGLLDIPYCTHPDNSNVARCFIDEQSGAAMWAATGAMPIAADMATPATVISAAAFQHMLTFNRRRFDNGQPEFAS